MKSSVNEQWYKCRVGHRENRLCGNEHTVIQKLPRTEGDGCAECSHVQQDPELGAQRDLETQSGVPSVLGRVQCFVRCATFLVRCRRREKCCHLLPQRIDVRRDGFPLYRLAGLSLIHI
eukprot:1252393-Pleurochrysis_carterae.AAC.1